MACFSPGACASDHGGVQGEKIAGLKGEPIGFQKLGMIAVFFFFAWQWFPFGGGG